MPPPKIAIQLSSLRLPFKRALEAARRLGASAVEFEARDDLRPRNFSETGLRQLRKLLSDLELRVAAIGFPTRRGYQIAEDLERRIEATKEAMRFARALGAPFVVNQVGRVDEAEDSAERRLMIEALTDLGAYGQHVGAMLAAETGTESGPTLAKLIADLPEGSLGVTFDPGNLIVTGFSPAEAIEALGSHVVHVHANDAVRDLAVGRGIETQLGRGSADFPALLGALEERGYRGYLSIEQKRSDDPVRDIEHAIRFIEEICGPSAHRS